MPKSTSLLLLDTLPKSKAYPLLGTVPKSASVATARHAAKKRILSKVGILLFLTAFNFVTVESAISTFAKSIAPLMPTENYTGRKKDHDYFAPSTYHIILKKNPDFEPFGKVEGSAKIKPGEEGCAHIKSR